MSLEKNKWHSVTEVYRLGEDDEVDIITSGTGERKIDAVWNPNYDEDGDLDGGYFSVEEEFVAEDYETHEVTYFMIIEFPK